jgi:hypothetical protein
MGVGIATEIALEITRYQEIRVLRCKHPRAGKGVPRISEPDSCSVEAFKPDAAGLKVIVSLVDGLTGMHIWGDSYRTDLETRPS